MYKPFLNICACLALVIALPCAIIAPMALANEADSSYKELSWDDLMPEDWEPSPPPPLTHESLEFSDSVPDISMVDAPIVETLDKQKVKIPGFIIPIEFTETTVTEFLLVPYMGACIHVPPPPTNQMVYVKLQEPMSSGSLWDPVWVSGKMLTQKHATEYADAGYTMEDAFTSMYIYE